ncbi:hypothetical protein DL98DRAFT_590751 [Cadophora sp. DSE1049]|nr:hypothetical protein DL98DRAFT_590751 [Cadophora sp. DSE1049]
MTKEELLAIRPHGELATSVFSGRQAQFPYPIPLTEKEAIKYCKMKGEWYERMKDESAEEDKRIDENLKGFLRSIRCKKEDCAGETKAEGDLALYDSTDEEDDGNIKGMGRLEIDAEDEADGWVLL